MLAPRRGLEPRTHWLTASRSTIELSGSAHEKEAEAHGPSASFNADPATTYSPTQSPVQYHRRWRA